MRTPGGAPGGRRGTGLQRHVDPAELVPQIPLVVYYRGHQVMDRGDCKDGHGKFVTASIPHIADRIGQGLRRLPKLMKIQVWLLSMHKRGRVVSNGPSTPPSPSKELMLSTEVCTYLRAVAEAATAQDAGNLWQPGPAPATSLKRLQPRKRGHSKGSRGRGGYHGGYDILDIYKTIYMRGCL